MNQNSLNKRQISELTKPSKSFNRHILIATLGLVLFIVIYFFLMIWFGKLSMDLFSSLSNGGSSNVFVTIISAVVLAFLSLFMLKSIIFFGKREKHKRHTITSEQEPNLFRFINEIADEANAPRPHKVFLSTRVNASVSYDLSLLNLIFPSKKNLEIGIGLVNVLNKGEFKSILAHEFGHFAQKSMLLGRYVYTAQQVVSRVVYRRDALDGFLRGLSYSDFRIAWVGWILSVMVWAVRAIIQTLFTLVSIVERALSREMEFHADLVSVSISGSDALVHSLSKLRAADEAYNASLEFISEQLAEKKAVKDICSLQSNYIEKMRWVLNDETYGKSPALDKKNGYKNRIFSPNNVSTPEMWSTHPADHDREENAKKVYFFKEIDDSDSWDLFFNAKDTREKLTAELIEMSEVKTELLSDEECIELMNKNNFSWTFLDPKFKGAYHSRYSYINFKNSDEIYDESISINKSFNELYTDDFSDLIDKLQELQKEISLLNVVENEVVTLEKRNISHRGSTIRRKDVPAIKAGLIAEEAEIRKQLQEKDSLIRSVHYKIAQGIRPSIGEYHKEVNKLVHYSEHTINDLNDATNKFHNTISVVLADGKVSSSEMTNLINDAKILHRILLEINKKKETIHFNSVLIEKAGGKECYELFEEYTFPSPSQENVDGWINNIFSWVTSANIGLNRLRNISLEHLLNLEDELMTSKTSNVLFTKEYPLLNLSLEKYKTLAPGQERKIQHKLGMWDRFQVGDGVFPSLAKFAVSVALIFAAVYFGNKFQETNLYLYNGFNIPVSVSMNNQKFYLEPNSYTDVSSPFEKKEVVATTENGEIIEEFEYTISQKAKNYIYNIGNSASFMEYYIGYGMDTYKENKNKGVHRWLTTDADYIFREPPESISISSNSHGTVRKAIQAFGSNTSPYFSISLVEEKENASPFILNHAKWDDPNSLYYQYWFSLGTQYDTSLLFLKEKLIRTPLNVTLLRLKQSVISPAEKEKLCQELTEKSNQDPTALDGDLNYLKVRCMEDGEEKNLKYLAGHKKFPKSDYFSYAAGYIYASKGKWLQAFDAMGQALKNKPQLRGVSAMDMERIRKILVHKGVRLKSDYTFLLDVDENVSYYHNLEKGDIEEIGENTMDNVYYLLSSGKTNEALTKAHVLGKYDYFEWYVAGSYGCSDKIVEKVLSLNLDSTINTVNVWIALGVMLREGKDISYLSAKNELLSYYGEEYNEKVQNFLKALKEKKYSIARRVVSSIDNFSLQCKLKLTAVIASNYQLKEWNKLVKLTLFPDERPYLR